MKTRTLVSILVLVLAVMIAFGICSTCKKTSTQENPTIMDIVGTWVNEEMTWDKIEIKPDGTTLWYINLADEHPEDETFILKDSWVGRDGYKYFKIHAIELFGEVGKHAFLFMRLNESETVLDWNAVIESSMKEISYDAPDKYPTEINPLGPSVYRIYYRQE